MSSFSYTAQLRNILYIKVTTVTFTTEWTCHYPTKFTTQIWLDKVLYLLGKRKHLELQMVNGSWQLTTNSSRSLANEWPWCAGYPKACPTRPLTAIKPLHYTNRLASVRLLDGCITPLDTLLRLDNLKRFQTRPGMNLRKCNCQWMIKWVLSLHCK